MSLKYHGLAKLIEECGELSEAAARSLLPPDGQDSILQALSDEIADVFAAISIVIEQQSLDKAFILAHTVKLSGTEGVPAQLIRACGGLIQIAAKKITFWHTDEHPDGQGSMKERLSLAIAKMLPVLALAMEYFDLNSDDIAARNDLKQKLFREWLTEQDFCGQPISDTI
ncbi:MAG: MazG-like family protein [Cyanobacteria bacterium P01_F01_bin.3]